MRVFIVAASFVATAVFAATEPKPGNFNPCPGHVLARVHDISRSLRIPVIPLNLGRIQERNRQIFKAKVVPLMNGRNPYYALPRGLPKNLYAPFHSLLVLTRNGPKVFELLQRIETLVVGLAQDEAVSLPYAFERTLLILEKRYGFGEPIVVRDFLDQESFLKLLSQARPIADEYWRGKPHTRDGHRLQTLVECMYLEERFGDRELGVRLYREMGNREAMLHDWKWEGSGINMAEVDPANPKTLPDVWAILHDTPFFVHVPHSLTGDRAPRDFTNPEFFGDLRPLLPGLIGWN